MKTLWKKWATTLIGLVAMISMPLAQTHLKLPIIQGSGVDSQGDVLNSPLDPEQIRQTLRLVADYQLDHRESYPTGHWTMAALYNGLIETSLVLNEPSYLAPVIRAGRRVAFNPGLGLGNADSHGAGNAWLKIYLMDPERNPEVLVTFEERFGEFRERNIARGGWSWVDALYMASPTLMRMWQASGDIRYLNLAFSETLSTYTVLFDVNDHLFYRDYNYIDDRSPNGEKVFWSRGNGWAYASLAVLLFESPEDHPSHDFFLYAFEQMSPALLAAQQQDGLWYANLHDPLHVPIGETSGSAFFLYGMARGVRQGILDQETYLPAIVRGWNALLTRIKPSGEVNYVQPAGERPEYFDPLTSEPYGTGAVLLAGTEILRLVNEDEDPNPAALLAQAEGLVDGAPDLSR